jgi:hypothetical protein
LETLRLSIRAEIGSLAKRVAVGRCVLAHAFAFRAQHQSDARRPQHLGEVEVGFAGQTDAPESGFRHFVECAGKVHHPYPRHDLQCAAGRLGERSAFWRCMAILGDDAERVEGGGRAQDGADIVRVRHLVEHQQGDGRPSAWSSNSASSTSSSRSTSATAPW